MTARILVGAVDELPERRASSVWWNDREYVVWQRSDGAYCGMTALCPHRQASLADGKVVKGEVSCPHHGWRFDSEGRNVFRPDGQPLCKEKLQVVPVIVEDDRVYIELGSSETVPQRKIS